MTDPEAKNILINMFTEKLRLFKLFRWNASLKHGVPIDNEPSSMVVVNRVEQPQPSVNNPSVTSTLEQTKETMPAWAKWLGAGLVASVLGLGGATSYLFMNQPDETSVVQPDRQDSALQWLEDEGEHLP